MHYFEVKSSIIHRDFVINRQWMEKMYLKVEDEHEQIQEIQGVEQAYQLEVTWKWRFPLELNFELFHMQLHNSQ